jgi:hypothetical protein
MHNIPLTEMEYRGLREHGLETDGPSQLSDAFRQGIRYALANMNKQSADDSKTNTKTAMVSEHETDSV